MLSAIITHRARQHEQDAGDQSADRPVQQPAEIDGELLRLRSRQQHAVVERVQEARLVDPALLVDDDPVHQRDLAGGPAEAEQADLQPRPERLAERTDPPPCRDAITRWVWIWTPGP